MNQAKGSRVSNLELRDSTGTWKPLDPAASYKVITNNFTADGGDKYDTLKAIPAAQREDTFLDYADSFLQYVRSSRPWPSPPAPTAAPGNTSKPLERLSVRSAAQFRPRSMRGSFLPKHPRFRRKRTSCEGRRRSARGRPRRRQSPAARWGAGQPVHPRSHEVVSCLTSSRRFSPSMPAAIRIACASNRNMRASPFVFLRGTCHLFYRRLPADALFDEAPPVWSCGDLHLQNFGSYKGDNRLVYFDLNDFDESLLAATLDLVRFLCSVLVAAPDMGVGRKEARALGRLPGRLSGDPAAGRAGWVERDTADGLIHGLLAACGRLRPAFLDGRTELKGKRRRLRVDNGKALPVTDTQKWRR
jgi:hypothetical protein